MNTANYVRPMSTRELFGSAFQLYRKHFGKLFLINLVQTTVVFLLSIFSLVIGMMGGFFSSAAGNYWGIVISSILGYIPSLIGLFVGAAMLVAVSNAVLNRPVRVRNSYRRAWSVELLFKMWIISIPFTFVGLIAFLPTILSNLTGWVWFSCLSPIGAILIIFSVLTLNFIYPVVLLEKKNVLLTIGRAFSLFASNVFRILFNYLLLFYIPAYAGMLFLSAIIIFPIIILISPSLPPGTEIAVGSLIGMIVSIFIGFVVGIFVTPFGTLLSILLYYDSRARKENYNETLLAEEMGYESVGEMI